MIITHISCNTKMSTAYNFEIKYRVQTLIISKIKLLYIKIFRTISQCQISILNAKPPKCTIFDKNIPIEHMI